MAWRRRRYSRVSGSVYRALQQAKALQRKQAYLRRVKRQAAVGRKLTTFLRSQGIAKGQLYSLSTPAALPEGTVVPKLTRSQLKAYAAEGKFVGRGGYNMRKFRRDMGQLGHVIGAPILGALENRIVGGISGSGLYTGRGAYNSLIEGGRPSMTYGAANDETQSIVISHCEYLQDVYGSANAQFSNQGWNLNPGLVENFPWLSQLAANYEEYEFIQLLFSFKSTVDASATNNVNGSTGTIIMATNYNPTSPLFTTKETMMQYHGANSGRLVDDHTHGVECDPNKNAGTGQKYVRTAPVVVGQDPKTFDLGTFQLATVNIPSAFFNQQIGELWVSYTVKLSKPRLATALCLTSQESRWVSGGGESLTNIGGTNLLSMQQNMIPAAVTGGAGYFSITFPDFITGLFEVQVGVEATGITSALSVVANVAGNVAVWNDLYATLSGTGDNPSNIQFMYNSTGYIVICRVFVNPVTAGVDNTLTVGMTGLAAGTILQSSLIIRQCNPAFAASSSVAAPVYVNSAGVVTSPV